MHSSDDTPLSEFLMSQAFAQGPPGDIADDHFLRVRIAMIVGTPGWIFVVWLALWIPSWVVGVAGLAVLVICLWLYTERADQVAALVRKRFTKSPGPADVES
jgi:hypothetical protein